VSLDTPSWPGARGWRDFFDLLSDAVVVIDTGARIVLANTAALRLLPCEAGMSVDQLQPALGTAAVQWLKAAAASHTEPAKAPALRLADGRAAVLTWRRLDARYAAMHLTADAEAPAARSMPQLGLTSLPTAGMRETIAFLWQSPFPAVLQDAEYRIVDINQAFLDFLGHTREQLIGRDPLEQRPADEWPAIRASRERLALNTESFSELSLVDGRIFDANGRERRYRAARRRVVDENGQRLFLAVLQDVTGEHLARERADGSMRELDDWFDLSPVGMVLSDERGLLVRTNPAFEALAGAVPVSLADAPAGLRELLGWGDDAAAAQALEPGAPPVQREGWVAPPGQPPRLLRANVRSYRTVGGQRRTMAVIEDRSAEEERDLAQMQIGALMDTAGVGLATFQESSGWVRQRQSAARQTDDRAPASAALHAINRDIVAAGSLPAYERLQSALRHAERAEVRYAIDHPELGERWLLTRVEPATLASGKRTTSVVTLDITEQHQAQLHTEQLLHELTTILESTSAGIAYLRDNVVVRCNRRFAAMLGINAAAMPGRNLQDLFGSHERTERIVTDAWQALHEGTLYETEFDVEVMQGRVVQTRWYSLAVRRAGQTHGPVEMIAVLSDVTRLKAQQHEFETLARESELMFSLSGVGIAFLRDDRIQRANQTLAHLTGRSVAELSAMRLSELFLEDEFDRRWSQVQHSLREHGRWTGERQLRVRDGRALWVQVSKRLVNEDDPAGGIIAAYVNVDARHRAERAVAMQADRTRSILDSVLVGIVTVGPQGIEWMNRSARRMFGADLADFVNLPIGTVATPDPDHPFLRTEYLTDLVEGQAETFECRVKARDGREFWVVGNVVSTARESTGRQLTYALLDIERRREAEARMSEVQTQLQRIIEAAPLAITLRDARTLKVLQVNDVAARNGRTTPAALIGRTPEQIFDPVTAAERRRDMERALATSQVSQHEYKLEQDGETRIWDARYLPLAATPGGPPDQLLLVATDVTEQHAAQQARLEAAIAQREMLVKEVHHRIKNNLQGVAGLLQQIAQRKPEVAGPIAEVVSQVQAIAQVYGLQVGESGPLELVGVVRAITTSVQRTFGRPIRFVVAGDAPTPWLLPEAEAIPIALTLNELLTNAVKHSVGEFDAEVLCTLACGDAEVRITISNRGQLAPEFNLARIPGGVSGLGLVRALLPRRSATLALEQRADQVLTTVVLAPPGVQRAGPPA
jgi:PAS domain S-box-containing protein